MRISIIILVIFLSGCMDGIERVKAPDKLIPRDKMVEVLTELVKLESYIQGKYQQVNIYGKTMMNSGDSLMLAHGISRLDLESSINYYGSRQTDMQEIYDEVLNKLNKELGKIESE